jgi:hypothetical protein
MIPQSLFSSLPTNLKELKLTEDPHHRLIQHCSLMHGLRVDDAAGPITEQLQLPNPNLPTPTRPSRRIKRTPRSNNSVGRRKKQLTPITPRRIVYKADGAMTIRRDDDGESSDNAGFPPSDVEIPIAERDESVELPASPGCVVPAQTFEELDTSITRPADVRGSQQRASTGRPVPRMKADNPFPVESSGRSSKRTKRVPNKFSPDL